MRRLPNEEQKLAIEHDGGVLLKAGAGSGKTFVLVEHVIYKLKTIQAELNHNGQELEKKLSQIVLMTFTNMAADEIRVRLFQRVDDEIEFLQKTGDDVEFWLKVKKYLDKITVTTIHGFCYKLIAQGFVPYLGTQVEIIDEVIIQKRVEDIIADYFLIHEAEILKLYPHWEMQSFKEVYSKIWLDPELKELWDHFDTEKAAIENLSFHRFLSSFQIDGFFSNILTPLLPQMGGEKWISYFEELKLRFYPLRDYQHLIQLSDYLSHEETKPPRKPASKKSTLEIEMLFSEFKKFRESIHKLADSFKAYGDSYESFVKPWLGVLKGGYDYLKSHFPPQYGLSFGDLEYQVMRALEHDEIVENISHYYSYYVVDEFQDTSWIQFKILKRLIRGNYDLLFCIGDPKQAIYGFRGGELGVFHELEKLIPRVLTLKMNYRSKLEVVDFNNVLFQDLFSRGLNFEGFDLNPVEFIEQSPAHQKAGGGSVKLLALKGDELLTANTAQLSKALALSICQLILSDYQGQQIAVLYKTMQPSHDLIHYLIRNRVGFTAQVKLDLDHDPISKLFYYLLEYKLSQDVTTRDGISFKIQKIIQSLTGHSQDISRAIEIFLTQSDLVSIFPAYQCFLSVLNFSHQFYESSLLLLEKICQINNQSADKIFFNLTTSQMDKVYHEISFGNQSDLVQIMSCHSSKGLEFDTVILGEVSLIKNRNFDYTDIGTEPGAFKWLNQDFEVVKSPAFLLETMERKIKDFSESKRLFYVACTRAMNNLVIPFFESPDVYEIGSWTHGMMSTKIFHQYTPIHLPLKLEDHTRASLAPLFHYYPLGAFAINPQLKKFDSIATTGDLSVTKLSTLTKCGYKFYLKHILRLTPPGKQIFEFNDDEQFYSSADRGKALHSEIEYALNHNFTISRSLIDSSQYQPVDFALSEIKKVTTNPNCLMTELEIKFAINGFMLVGVLDLFIQQHNQIWDFKTGRRSDDSEESYWNQLIYYAYGLYALRKIDQKSLVTLCLCYIDDKVILTKEFHWSDISTLVKSHWSLLANLNSINKDHCSSCEMSTLCPYRS